MAKRKPLDQDGIDRILFEEEDLSDVEDASEVVIEADRVFDDIHDALTWQEEEEEYQPEVTQEEVEAALDDVEPQPSTSQGASPSLSLSEIRSTKRRRGPPRAAEGESLTKMPNEIYKAKDRVTVWHSEPNPRMPFISRSDDIVAGAPTISTERARTPAEVFALFINDPLLAEVCVHTVDKMTALREKFSRQDTPTLKDVTLMEMKAFIAVLIMAGPQRDNHLTTEEMFSQKLGCPFYRSVMSERRFSFLLRSLRFDDSATREERRKSDVFTPVRNLWNAVIRQCIGNYNPGPHVTVDEQLLAFRGRCRFRMYIANKQAK